MAQHAVRGRNFRRGHAPLFRGGLDQHRPGRGASLADIVVRSADAARAGREEIAPHAVARKILTGRRIFSGYLGPVAFQLLGNELREPRERPLSHLRARHADDHRVIGLYHHPRVDLGRRSRACESFRKASPARPKGRKNPIARPLALSGRSGARRFLSTWPTLLKAQPFAAPAAAWIAARTR